MRVVGGPRWFTIVMTLVGAVVLLALGLVAYVYVSFSGGLDDVFPRKRPKESSPEVVRARTRAERTTPAELASLVDAAARRALGADLRTVLPATPPTKHECTTGQHNWKIDDPYDLRCTMQATSIVVAGMGGFREQMLRLHEQLLAAGWTAQPEDHGIPEAILEYWDTNQGSFPGSPSGDDAYTPADLPFEQYRRADDAEVRLEVRWTDRTDRFRPEAAAIAEGDYGVVLMLERVYFER